MSHLKNLSWRFCVVALSVVVFVSTYAYWLTVNRSTVPAEILETSATDDVLMRAWMHSFVIGPLDSGYDTDCATLMKPTTLYEYDAYDRVCVVILEDVTKLSLPIELSSESDFWYQVWSWSQDERRIFFIRSDYEGLHYNDVLVFDRDNLDAGFQRVPMDTKHHYEHVSRNSIGSKVLLLPINSISNGVGTNILLGQILGTLSVFDADSVTIRDVFSVDTNAETFLLPAQLYDFEGEARPDIHWVDTDSFTVQVIPVTSLEEYQRDMRMYCVGIVDGTIEIDTDERRAQLRRCSGIEARIFDFVREVKIDF